jgi:PAS domain S-box-containing protein
MAIVRSRPSWELAKPDSTPQTAILVCLVATLSYLAPKLASALLLHPGTVWPLWPGCALLVSVLVMVPPRIWPIVVPAALAGFALFDMQAGVPIGSIAWFILADTVQVLTAALCLSYFFDGMPRLNSVMAVCKYSLFAVLLAPTAGAFFSALGIRDDYWRSWGISFLSEALAFVTLTPAILSWVGGGPAWARKSRAYYLEFAALIAGLVILSYGTFTASQSDASPLMLYACVPFLLWAALRFGSWGSSSAAIVISFISIWGAVRGRGPFINEGPLSSMMALQLFLIFVAAPFTVLAALVEERKQAEKALREGEERLRLAVQAGRVYAFEWDMASDVIVRTGQCKDILDWMEDPTRDIGREFVARVHTDDREAYAATETGLTIENSAYHTSYRMLRPDGSVIWLEESGRASFDDQGRMLKTTGLVADVTERKQAEAALRETEERFRLVADTAPALIWMSGIDKLCTFFNKGWLDFTGRSLQQESGNGWAEGVHPEDQPRCLLTYTHAFDRRESFSMTYRLRRHDGEYRWILHQGVPRFSVDGSFAGYIGSCIDITEQKRAEEALSTVSQRLIQAHEEERTWLARELHDDINQRLALLAVTLEVVKRDLPMAAAEARRSVGEIKEQVKDLGNDVQALSHRLHSSKLEILGLEKAAVAFCSELFHRHRVEIDFHCENIPKRLPPEISICLFRVLQEALQNAIKHSGSRHLRVWLRGGADEIELAVHDSGVGFEPEEAIRTHGLGIISMKERLKLVDGQFSIESKSQRGTSIHVWVPLGPRMKSVVAVG